MDADKRRYANGLTIWVYLRLSAVNSLKYLKL